MFVRACGASIQEDGMRKFLFNKLGKSVIIPLMLVFAGTAPALAQTDMPKFEISTRAYTKGDVDDRNGKYSVTKTNITASYRWFTLSYTHSDYDWKHPGRLPFGNGDDPWDTFHKLMLDAHTDDYITENLSWFGGATVVSGFEDEMTDSFSLIGRGGLRYAFTPELGVSLGAVGMLSPVHSMALPLVGVHWRNEEDYGFSANIGYPLTSVRYRFNDMLRVRAVNYWSRDVTRLANDSNVRRKGYVEESGYTAGAYLDIMPLPGLTATVGAEYMYDRDMRIYNKSGHRKGKYDVEDAFGGILRLNYKF